MWAVALASKLIHGLHALLADDLRSVRLLAERAFCFEAVLGADFAWEFPLNRLC